MTTQLRNIAIIAHVDHGKTTLVDALLKQSGTFAAHEQIGTCVMDSNDLEKERGITILAKNTAIRWRDYRINIVDTPGHADFGGEVERVLSMVDSVLLLVDAVDGPMPQTRFVTRKAFACGLKPIVVVNKIDRPGARAHWVHDQTFDLFDKLGASEEQLDFPVIYASALQGYAGLEPGIDGGDMTPLFEAIVQHVPPPPVDPHGPFQMQVSSLDYSSYVGAIAVGRIQRGHAKTGQLVTVIDRHGDERSEKILQILGFHGLKRTEVAEAAAGDIVAVTGLEAPRISDTLCDPARVEALPALTVDEPTMTMTVEVNTSPFAGKDGKYITSRHLHERLQRELIHNVALRVEDTDTPDSFRVSGRGELHLTVLLENMRREGYGLAVSRPQVIYKEIDGARHEPYENLVLDVETGHQGAVMERLGSRKAEFVNMNPDGKGRVRLEYLISSRGLIGFRNELLTATAGTGLLYSTFSHYGPANPTEFKARINGVMISNAQGPAIAYALFNLQQRGRLFVKPGDQLYEGMIVGIHSRDNDLVVNPLKEKKLTNVRAAGSDENILLTPPVQLTLERAIEFIADDELVEITPHHLRLRKRWLKQHERKRAAR